jgi:hypothetical protein
LTFDLGFDDFLEGSAGDGRESLKICDICPNLNSNIMKSINFFRIVAILGAVLVIASLVFIHEGWPDSFKGIYSGSALILIWLLVEVFQSKKEGEINNFKQLSSRITVVYQIGIPFGGFIALIIYFAVILVRGRMLDFLLPLGFFITFLWLIMLIVGVSIFSVSYDTNTLVVEKFGKQKKISIKNVLHVNKFLVNFYIIESKDNDKYMFIPHISEIMSAPNSDPKSIELFRREVENAS